MDYHRGEPLRHVGDLPAMAADRYEGKLAFEYQGDELTYRELEERSNSLADSLVEHGVEPGERVAIYIENSLQFPVSFFGIIKAGGVAVPLNHRMATGNLTYILEDGEVDLLVASPVFATTAEDLYDETGVETVALPGGTRITTLTSTLGLRRVTKTSNVSTATSTRLRYSATRAVRQATLRES